MPIISAFLVAVFSALTMTSMLSHTREISRIMITLSSVTLGMIYSTFTTVSTLSVYHVKAKDAFVGVMVIAMATLAADLMISPIKAIVRETYIFPLPDGNK
jgi:hypothetical protein